MREMAKATGKAMNNFLKWRRASSSCLYLPTPRMRKDAVMEVGRLEQGGDEADFHRRSIQDVYQIL